MDFLFADLIFVVENLKVSLSHLRAPTYLLGGISFGFSVVGMDVNKSTYIIIIIELFEFDKKFRSLSTLRVKYLVWYKFVALFRFSTRMNSWAKFFMGIRKHSR